MPGPYHGLRVVDLAAAMAGSYAAMILAEALNLVTVNWG